MVILSDELFVVLPGLLAGVLAAAENASTGDAGAVVRCLAGVDGPSDVHAGAVGRDGAERRRAARNDDGAGRTSGRAAARRGPARAGAGRARRDGIPDGSGISGRRSGQGRETLARGVPRARRGVVHGVGQAEIGQADRGADRVWSRGEHGTRRDAGAASGGRTGAGFRDRLPVGPRQRGFQRDRVEERGGPVQGQQHVHVVEELAEALDEDRPEQARQGSEARRA